MAIVERSGLWRYLDGDGNEAILYPVTLADNVDGVGEPGGIAQLDENGKVPLEQLPEMASGDLGNEVSEVRQGLDDHTADTTVHVTAAERAKLLQYGDADGEAGMFDKLTTAPTETGNPLRYNGTFRATQVRGMYFADDADLAERYHVEGAIEPGELVMICEDGTLRRNNIAGNPRVLGIVSSAPAMVLGDGDGGVPIALDGRVPVRIAGKVTAGDLLCGAVTAGALMKAGADAPRGSIVARALESGEDCEIIARILQM